MLYEQIQDAVRFIRQTTTETPKVGIILGTGLSGLAEEIKKSAIIDYSAIPHFPVSTVKSHAGKLIFGTLGGQQVVAMAGRFHYYEGYSLKEVTFPVRVMKALGIELIIISNAAGSTNANMQAGDMVFITSHIDMMPDNPLRGPNDDRLGDRFPDLLHSYDAELVAKASAIAKAKGYRAHKGVYTSLSGPNLETPAEYRFINSIGSDLVGMSTVPEVLVAKHAGIKVFVVSVVSNKCFPIEEIVETSLEDVIRVVEAAEPKVRDVVKELLMSINF